LVNDVEFKSDEKEDCVHQGAHSGSSDMHSIVNQDASTKSHGQVVPNEHPHLCLDVTREHKSAGEVKNKEAVERANSAGILVPPEL
jgi:uncharacterized Zn-finger protein